MCSSDLAQMLAGSVPLAAIAYFMGEGIPASPSLKSTLAVAYLVVFGSILAFTAYIYLLNRVRPALATSYAYVNPPIAVLFGVLLAGETFGPFEAVAMVVILVGVVVILTSRAR